MRTPTKILVVESHPIVREGLVRLIDSQPDLCVCASPPTVTETLSEAQTTRPDVVILDSTFGNEQGVGLLTTIRVQLTVPVIVFSRYDQASYASRMLRAGAVGYVTKSAPVAEILAAVRHVLSGEVYVSESMTGWFAKSPPGNLPRVLLDYLTEREFQVFELIGKGVGTRTIAEQLRLSSKTVQSYRERLKTKLRLRTGAELMYYAVRQEFGRG